MSLSYEESTIYNYICILFCLLTVLMYRKHIFKNTTTKKNNYLYFGILITSFSLLYRAGFDFIGHQSLMESYIYGDYYRLHMEPFFYWLIDVLPKDYIVWRAAVWGLSAIIIIMCFKIMDAKKELATILFITLTLTTCFYYLRNVLGFSVLYLGVIIFSKYVKSKKYLYTAVGLIFIILSVYLHKAMPLYIGISLIAILLPINKYTITISLALFPFLYYSIHYITSYFLNLDYIFSMTNEYGNLYFEQANSFKANILGIIGLIIIYFPTLFIIYTSIKLILDNRTTISYTQKNLLNITYILIYVSFLFIGQIDINIQARFWKTASLPLVLYLSTYLEDKRHTKYSKIFFISIIIQYIYIVFISYS